ncbi:MAG: hypothetical protein AB1540_16630 [Bdellovibrionota bacterium]
MPKLSTTFYEEPLILPGSEGEQLEARWCFNTYELHAVMLLLPGQGSNPVDLDGRVTCALTGPSIGDVPPDLNKHLAHRLAEKGIATLRYTKRSLADRDLAQNLVKDAQIALKHMKGKFPYLQTGILGFSEGALLAMAVASEDRVDALFLIAPPTRRLSEVFRFQYLDWSHSLFSEKLDTDRDGFVTAQELNLFSQKQLPLTGKPWDEVLDNSKEKFSIADEILPIYQGLHENILLAMQNPPFLNWFSPPHI